MKFKAVASTFLAGAASLVVTAVCAASPYAGQESREIKALSPEDVSDYRAGKGMGFAKTAELNGFAGPAHVLELATQLQLTREQRARTEELFTSMQMQASASGRLLVTREGELDALFATKAITPAQVTLSLQEIATLQARIRDAHLQAHLAQVQILTPEQNARYALLRGYGAAQEQADHHHTHSSPPAASREPGGGVAAPVENR
jgi:Spy/CpxP family protein refolding chaperone